MLEENSENFAQVGFYEFENLMKQIGDKMDPEKRYITVTWLGEEIRNFDPELHCYLWLRNHPGEKATLSRAIVPGSRPRPMLGPRQENKYPMSFIMTPMLLVTHGAAAEIHTLLYLLTEIA